MIGYRMPTRVHIEPGAIQRLPEAARSLGLASALLVVDQGLKNHTPWASKAERALQETGIRVAIFDQVEQNRIMLLRSFLGDMEKEDAMAFLIQRLKRTASNREFFSDMER